MMKKFKFLIPLGLIILLPLVASDAIAAKKNAIPLDRIVAVINDQVITESELTEAINSSKKQIASSNISLPSDDVLHKQVLDQLINKKLEFQVAEQMGVHVTDQQVDKAINDIATNNKVPVSEVYQKVAQTGVNMTEYRKELHDEILLQQVQQQAVGSKITITPQEVSDFMRSKTWQAFNTKEYHLEDILITLPDVPTPKDVAAAKKHAEDVFAKLQHGMSFNEAAAAESGEKNALQGGDLGWRKLPEIPSAFADKLIYVKTGELLGPVQTPNGFHIVRLAGVRSNDSQMTATQQRMQVEQLIFQRKLEEGLQSWVAKLRGQAFINTHPEV